MGAPLWGSRFLLGFAIFAYSIAGVNGAIGPDNVLVLYNSASVDGLELAQYYSQVHPGVHLLGLNGVTTAEEVTDDFYQSVIRPQILPHLNDSISTIVTTKGLPLRIKVYEPNPLSYQDPFGINRNVGSGWWRTYSSLESELTRIDVISTPQQMGDQTYYSQAGTAQNIPQPARNPYYLSSSAFEYSDYQIPGYGGMRLSARLDGFTTSDVKSAINRAQKALVFPNSNTIVLDDDPTAGNDRMAQLKNNVLAPRYQTFIYDNTDAAITTAPNQVIGYVGHGTNDGPGGLNSGYIPEQMQLQLANGAVFQSYESFNAYSFQPGGNLNGQGLVAEWLAAGGTAAVGHVAEPFNGTSNVANEDQMFKMLLNGYTWGEAAWSSMQQLSYVNTVVGDPLMTWKQPIPGAITYTGPLYVGYDGNDNFVVNPGGSLTASSVQVGNIPGSSGTFSLEGGTLDLSDPGDTLTVGVNGTFNYNSGTLKVHAIDVKGDGISGGRVNAIKLETDTLTIGAGATVTITPIMAPLCKSSSSLSVGSCISSTGTTTIQNGSVLQINTQFAPVTLNAITGNGYLGIGDGTNPTILITQSINVKTLTIGAGSKVIIIPITNDQPKSGSSAQTPEPNTLVLIASGGIGLLFFLWRRNKRKTQLCTGIY